MGENHLRNWNGKIALDIRDSVQDWTPYLSPRAPEGSPNVLVVCWDDVGYGAMDVFGGPIETPTMRRIAERGVRYSNFHSTALCSPTRACLLTGRNATSNGMATIAEFTAGFPGFNARIPFENGFVSEVLNVQGWNTYCVGKWHLTPGDESNVSAWKGRWPLGRGFERFYGFLSGEASSWYPDLIADNSPVRPPARPEDGYHLSDDLTDKAIAFIRDGKVINPDKPFFMYFAPQAGHAPHHVPLEWADRYKGRFDAGYEAIRPEILAREVELGLLPPDTALTPMNPHGEPDATGPAGQPWPRLDTVRPWDTLSDDEKRLFARMAEVFAGFISYADDQLGRLVDYLEESGQLDNTIIVVVSDNGSSGEGGPDGTFNEWRFFNALPDRAELTVPYIDKLGTTEAFNNYNTGWAWAFDTPFPYWKRWAGYEGGVADMCLVSWPAKIPPQVQPRQQYVHAVDVVPTLYELMGITPPEVIRGAVQSPLEGESFAASLTDADAPAKETQFFTMLGGRSLYHQGWLASALHPPISGWGNFEDDEWELYHVEVDRSQSTNLAAKEPGRLEAMKHLWHYQAGLYNGLPLDDRTGLEVVLAKRPAGAPNRDRWTYYPDCAPVPELAGVRTNGRSYTIAAGVVLGAGDAAGVLYAHGGVTGGHSLYVKDRRLHYAYNWVGTHLQVVRAESELDPGSHVLTAEFRGEGPSTDRDMPGLSGTVTLYVDGVAVGSAPLVTQPAFFCTTADGICVGRDGGSGVTREYTAPFAFSGGTIDKVVVDVTGEPYADHEAEVRAWFAID
jgi:arylsulfatase A-like enzyme